MRSQLYFIPVFVRFTGSPKCYTIKIDSFQSKSFNVVFIKFGPYSDTLIIKRYFIADNYSQILRFE